MKTRIIPTLAGALALTMGASTAALAAQQTPNQAASHDRMTVASATVLMGKPVRDKDWKKVGNLKFLMIRPDSGKILYAVVGNDDATGPKRFTAIPWKAVQAKVWSGWRSAGFALKTSRAKVKSAPRYSFDRLIKLVSPEVQAKIGKHFAVAVEPTEGPEKSGLLFGTDYLVSLKTPIAQTDSQLLGQTVTSKDGQTVGQIDELVVDVAKGRIAYVLLREKGYLGTGGKWLPVPLQAMKWTDNGYVVDVAASDLDSMKRLDRTTFPSWIRKSDLKKLYDQFDIEPYWSS